MLLPKIGRPMELGKISSRKKCSCAMAPTLLPLCRLTGIIASTPTWNLSPTQITPGLMVPVVTVPELDVFETGVCNDASTSGIR